MASNEMIVPSEIKDNEPLLRAISTPSCLDSQNRPTHLSFRLRARIKEKDLSLSRMFYDSLMGFIQRSLHFSWRDLGPKDVPAGALELLSRDVHSLDKHIILKPSPKPKNPAHASIYFMKEDGSYYTAGSENTTDPVDSSILGYELALASIVSKVYDKKGNIIWIRE